MEPYQSVLYGAVSVIALLLFCGRFLYLSRHGQAHHLGRTAWIYWPTQIAMTLAAAVILVEATVIGMDHEASLVAVLGSIGMGVAWVNDIPFTFVLFWVVCVGLRTANFSTFVFFKKKIIASSGGGQSLGTYLRDPIFNVYLCILHRLYLVDLCHPSNPLRVTDRHQHLFHLGIPRGLAAGSLYQCLVRRLRL